MITDDPLDLFSDGALRRCAGESEMTELRKRMNNLTMNFPVCYGIPYFVPHKCYCNEEGCNGSCEKGTCQSKSVDPFEVQWCESQCKDEEVSGISKGSKFSTTVPTILIMTLIAIITIPAGMIFNTLSVIDN